MSQIPLAVALLATAVLVGCSQEGPRPMQVWGQVDMDGKPLEDGKITLTPTGETPGGSCSGAISQGKYQIPSSEGPFAKGTYKVEISSLAKQGKALPNVVDPGGPSLAVFEELVPAAYNSASTLVLTVSEESSKNEHNFQLIKKAQR